MAIIIENKFDFGDIVYLKTDKDQLPRVVVSFSVFKAGELLYKIVSGTTESSHYDFEISKEENILLTTTN